MAGHDHADHERLVELVLSLEDLEGRKREEADDHLRECEACTRRLQRLRDWERRAEATGELPPLDDAQAFQLSPEEVEAEARSYRALVAKVTATQHAAVESPVALVEPRAERRRFLRWLIPVTAAAATVAALVLFRPAGPELGDTRAVPGQGAVTRDANGRAVWRAGQVVALEGRLTEEAYLVVVLVDSAGELSLVYPENESVPPAPPGPFRMPPEHSGSQWVLSGGSGSETFLLVADTRAPALAELRQELQAVYQDSEALGRTERVAAVVSWLESRFDSVQRIEVAYE